MAHACGAQFCRNLQLARHHDYAHTRRGCTAHTRGGILDCHALSRVNAQALGCQKVGLRIGLGVGGLVVANNDRECALGCGIGGAARNGGGGVRDDSCGDVCVAHLAQEGFDARQEFNLSVGKGLAHLSYEQVVDLLVRQVHAALAQAIQGELHG